MDTQDRVITLVDRLLEQGRAEGLAQARAERMVEATRELLLDILAARGIAVPEAISARVMACADADQLVQWAIRAATAKDVVEIFVE